MISTDIAAIGGRHAIEQLSSAAKHLAAAPPCAEIGTAAMCGAMEFLKRAGLDAGDHSTVGTMANLLVHHRPDAVDVWIDETAVKMAFGTPPIDCIRGSLAEWANDPLSERSLSVSGLFGAGYIRRYLDSHVRSRRNTQYALGTIIMFRAWHRRWA